MLAITATMISISDYCGVVKGRMVIRIFNKYRNIKDKPYWGNHFWIEEYCVDTVGLDSGMARKCLKYQENRELTTEQQG
jgi:putative transposase